MPLGSSTNDDEVILAAAVSAILGKTVVLKSNVSQLQLQQAIRLVCLFNQHVLSLAYAPVEMADKPYNEAFIKLNVKVFGTSTTFLCEIQPNATVDTLKQFIYERAGISCNEQNLTHRGQEIDDGHELSEYGIQNLSTIVVKSVRNFNIDDVLVLDASSWDRGYDYDFTNIDDKGKTFMRGGIQYRRPCGWKRHAINVAGKYKEEVWLGSKNCPGEWAVSYHGTGLNQAKSIAEAGFDLTRHKRFAHGRGIYSSPDINVAKAYAKPFIFNEQHYLVLLQNRVNPENVKKLDKVVTGIGEFWISPSDQDIRPYGVCIMKK